MCSWVSSASQQYLHLRVSWPFLWFILTVIILVLALSIAWLCFLVSLSMYSGLRSLGLVLCFLQWLIFVFFFWFFSISFSHSSWALCFRMFLSVFFFSFRCHFCMWYFSMISIVFFIHMLLSVVLYFIREFPSFSSILLACIILFIFISCLIGINPDSFSSIVVGVPWGRFIIISGLCWISFVSGLLPFLLGSMLLIHMLRLGWWWPLCIDIWLPFSSLWILCPLFLLVFSGWLPLFWFLGLSCVLQGCLSCCIFFLGICIWVPGFFSFQFFMAVHYGLFVLVLLLFVQMIGVLFNVCFNVFCPVLVFWGSWSCLV